MNKSQLLSSLKQKGFSKEILNAFEKIPRENFLPEELKSQAYEDTALPIGEGQTISQPYTIAIMLSMLELKPEQKILEIGSGCGYVLALLSQIVKEVYGIEIIKELTEKSKENLRNYPNIKIYNKNGKDGLKEHSSYDRILISAACKKIPEKLLSQLKDRGILVAPVGEHEQSLVSVQKIKNKFIIKKKSLDLFFVPFIEN